MEKEVALASLGAGTVIFHRGEVLLVQINYGPHGGAWILPGGLVQEGEHPAEAAIRETLEETGQDIDLVCQLAVRHRILEDNDANVYWVFLGRLLSASEEDPHPSLRWPKDEIIEAKFWDVKKALQDKSVRPLTRTFVQMGLKALAEGSGHPSVKKPSDHAMDDQIFGVKI